MSETHAESTSNPKVSSAAEQPGVANQQKDPSDWVTGDEPMTGAQASYLNTLSEQADGADGFDAKLSKAEASKRIDALRQKTVASALAAK